MDSQHTFFRNSGIDIFGDEETKVVLRIVDGPESAESVNNTCLVSPKVKNPILLTQFRPISLCIVLYKIISKVIANQLKEVLPEIISAGFRRSHHK